jgi:hypothetical protein
MTTRDSRVSATSIDSSGPPRSRAARRRAATNRSSESMVSVSRMSSKLSAGRVWRASHSPAAATGGKRHCSSGTPCL